MTQNIIVTDDAELVPNVLYKGDTVYNDATGIEYRVKVVNTAGAKTLAGLIAAADVAIEVSTVAAADIAIAAYPLTAAFGAAFPTADPAVAGEVWSNLGVLTVSAG